MSLRTLTIRDPDTLQSLMDAHGLSQSELARQAECSPRLIRFLLQGQRRVSPEIAARICQVLKVPVAGLFRPQPVKPARRTGAGGGPKPRGPGRGRSVGSATLYALDSATSARVVAKLARFAAPHLKAEVAA